MAKKPFEIQSADLVIGGVNLQAGVTGLIIPGITQATGYYVDEVDKVRSLDEVIFEGETVIVLDNAQYSFYNGDATSSPTFVAAQYTVHMDDGVPEEVEVDEVGNYSIEDKQLVEQGGMWFTDVPDATSNFNSSDWTYIRGFLPRMRAGEVENIGGGGSADLGGLSIEGTTLMPAVNGDRLYIDAYTNEENEALLGAQITLDADNGIARMVARGSEDNTTFTDESWGTAVWTNNGYGGGVVNLTNAQTLYDFLNNINYENIRFSINGSERITLDSWGAGGNGETLSLGAPLPDEDPTTVTSIEFLWQAESKIEVDYDDGLMLLRAQDLDLLLLGDDDITLEAADGVYLEANNAIRLTARGTTTIDSTEVDVITQYRPRVQRTAEAGTDGSLFVSSIVDNDDVIAVQVGWFVEAEGGEFFVTAVDNTVEGEYRITINGFTFSENTDYIFFSPDQTQTSWTFASGGDLQTPGNGVISHQNNDLRIETTGETDVINLRTAGGDWVFDNEGNITFPDGSVQTTAYTGNSEGEPGPMYIVANVDGNIIYSTDGTTFSEAIDTGMSSIGTVAVGPNRIVFSGLDINGDSDFPGLYGTTSPIVQPTLISGTSGSGNWYLAQVKYFPLATPSWVAVGVDTSSEQLVPIVLYSTDGVSWNSTTINSDYLNNTFLVEDAVALRFTDIQYQGGGWLISADRNGQSGSKGGGLWWTTDITQELTGDNFIAINANFKAVESFVNSFFSKWHAFTTSGNWWVYANTGYPTSVEDWQGDEEFSDLASMIQQETNLSGQTFEEAASGLSTITDGEFGQLYVWVTSSSNGHIVWWPNIPVGPFVSLPAPYTVTITSFSQSANSNINPIGDGGPGYLQAGEKFTITGSSVAGYNGTFYTDGSYFVYTDAELTTPFDTSLLEPFTGTATLTWSHGQYIDAVAVADGYIYAANDDEEVYRGEINVEGGITWTKLDDKNDSLQYWNTIGFYDGFASTLDNAHGYITFSGNQIRGSQTDDFFGLIELVPSATATAYDQTHNFIEAGQYLRIYPTISFDQPHIHITAGEGVMSRGDLFLGDDQQYVKVASGGNIEIATGPDSNVSIVTNTITTSSSIIISGEGKGLVVDADSNKRVGFMKYFGMEASFIHSNTHPFQIGRVDATDVTAANASVFASELYIGANGNIGINTSTPSERLVVAGNADVNGNITLTGNLTGNTAGFEIGYKDVPQNYTNTSFTLAMSDRGKHIYTANGTAQTITIANNASVAFPIGTAISIVNQGAGTITIARGAGVSMYLAANSTSADRTLSTYGMASILKVGTNTWFINGAGVA